MSLFDVLPSQTRTTPNPPAGGTIFDWSTISHCCSRKNSNFTKICNLKGDGFESCPFFHFPYLFGSPCIAPSSAAALQRTVWGGGGGRGASKTPCVHASIKKMHKKRKGWVLRVCRRRARLNLPGKKIARERGGKQMLGKFQKMLVFLMKVGLFQQAKLQYIEPYKERGLTDRHLSLFLLLTSPLPIS